MKKVAIVQRTLVQYRREFFDGLKNALAKEGVELTLIYGKQSKDEGLKNDEMDLLILQNRADEAIRLIDTLLQQKDVAPQQLRWLRDRGGNFFE